MKKWPQQEPTVGPQAPERALCPGHCSRHCPEPADLEADRARGKRRPRLPARRGVTVGEVRYSFRSLSIACLVVQVTLV